MNRTTIIIGLVALNLGIFALTWVFLPGETDAWYKPMSDALAGTRSTWWIPFVVLAGTSLLSLAGWFLFMRNRSGSQIN